MQLFQNADHVIILNEMVHDARVVPLDGRPHLLEDVRQWMGDSRGHWEGGTLVVDTTNFTDKTSSFSPSAMVALASGEHLHLTERFTRMGPDTLLYEFTVHDPRTFTRPFTAAVPMKKLDVPIFEYACHEGKLRHAQPAVGSTSRRRQVALQGLHRHFRHRVNCRKDVVPRCLPLYHRVFGRALLTGTDLSLPYVRQPA